MGQITSTDGFYIGQSVRHKPSGMVGLVHDLTYEGLVRVRLPKGTPISFLPRVLEDSEFREGTPE